MRFIYYNSSGNPNKWMRRGDLFLCLCLWSCDSSELLAWCFAEYLRGLSVCLECIGANHSPSSYHIYCHILNYIFKHGYIYVYLCTLPCKGKAVDLGPNCTAFWM